MATFTLQATLVPKWPASYVSELTSNALMEVIAGSVVCQLLVGPTQCDATLDFRRAGCDIALQDFSSGADRLGLSVIKAVIVRWTTAVAEAGLAGMVVGTIGGAAARNPVLTLATAAAGTAIGAYVGQFIQYEIARYVARPDDFGGWRISDLAPVSGRQIRFAVG
jgi:hypothetical protein